MNAQTIPATEPTHWAWHVNGYGTRHGTKVLIVDWHIHANSEAEACEQFRAQHRRDYYTNLVIEKAEQVVDHDGPEVERLQAKIRRLQRRIDIMRLIEVPVIELTVNNSWNNDPQCDECVTVGPDIAERAVARLIECHADELEEIAQEIAP